MQLQTVHPQNLWVASGSGKSQRGVTQDANLEQGLINLEAAFFWRRNRLSYEPGHSGGAESTYGVRT
jgi:hypothetical protein